MWNLWKTSYSFRMYNKSCIINIIKSSYESVSTRRSYILWVTNNVWYCIYIKELLYTQALTNIKAHAKTMVFLFFLSKKVLTFSKGCRTLGGGKDPLCRVHSENKRNFLPFKLKACLWDRQVSSSNFTKYVM